MLLLGVHIIEILLLFACIGITYTSRERNWGLIGVQSTMLVNVSCCIILTQISNLKHINITLSVFYMSVCWSLFFLSKMINSVNTAKKFSFYLNPAFYPVLAASGIMVYNNISPKSVFSSKKTILLGENWWVISVNSKSSFLFTLFMSLLIIVAVYIVVCLVYKYFKTAKIYRIRIVVLITNFVPVAIACFVSSKSHWPLWIVDTLMFIITMVFTYLVVYFPASRLTRNSLFAFANDLSEGFILYDDRERLVYINSLLRGFLSEEELKKFDKKAAFEEWASDIDDVKGIEVKKIEAEGRTYYFTIHEQFVGDEDKIVGTFYNLKEQTESINQIEIMEKANEELELATQLKSDFLANMSHEIRTPMNAVIGMAEMALREELSPQAAGYVNQIKNSGHNLLNIINDILDFSKIESGKMDIIPDVYEPASEYQDVANTLMTRIGDKNLELIVNVAPDIPNKLKGDAMRIRQVLINIANNAIKFTKEGMVCINVTCDKLSDEMVKIIIHVVDTGMGIKSDDLEKLFVSFQQVDAKRNRSIEGTGLGLAISKSLVEAMGGSIGVDSEYGKGSDFYFEIPQEIVEATPAMAVDNAAELTAIGVFDKDILKNNFEKNMKLLGVKTYMQNPGDDYEAAYKKCMEENPNAHSFVFFDKTIYDQKMRSFLDNNSQAEGIIFVDFDSLFTPEQANLRVVRRPFTTLSLSLILQNKTIAVETSGNAFSFDFIAPEAKVLIVDDNNINIAVAQGLLEPLNMSIYTAGSGKEAIKRVEEVRFDIIFMDHMMPEMDGIETTHYIRQHLPQAEDTPIIALTANAISGAKDMFLKNGMNDFVSKPIELKAIVSKVKQWLPADKIIKGKTIVDANQSQNEETVDIPGLDCAAAIQLIGTVKLYKKIASDYRNGIDTSYKQIQDCYDNQDWENYTIKVHALKSSSRQIGAMEFSKMAERLEAAGRVKDKEFITANTDEMLKEYRRIQSILDGYYGEASEEAAELKEFDPTVVSELMQKLKEGCDELDMDVMQEVREQLGTIAFGDDMKNLIAEIMEAIDAMDVDTCEEKANELLGMIG